MLIVFHVLHSALHILLFSENELCIDGKKHELKKEESNNIGATNAKREENWTSDTLRAKIPHKTHI